MTDYVLGPSPADWEWLDRDLEVDPVTFEILRHKLEAMNEQQAIALKAVSVSPIVTDASDFNNALYTPTGEIVSMGPHVIFHSGGMACVIRHVIADCTETVGIGEGDMFIVNDPFKGAVHHPDASLVAPIHFDGELVAWTGATAHLVDLGGMTVGSISVEAHEKQQEGLMMPPLKVIEGGRMRQDVWNLILNMSRQPEMVGLDLKGFIAANVVCRRRLVDLMERYGPDTVKVVMGEMIRYSERRFRRRLLELPDGEFRSRGFLDHDGHQNKVYRTDVRVIKEGDVLRFDMSESSLQAPGFINCTESGLIGAVYGSTAPLLAADIPWNHGIMNAIEAIAPAGLICNALPPAPTGAATISEAWMLTNTIVHALSKLLSLHPELRRQSQAVTNGTFDALIIGDHNQHGEHYGTQLMDAQIGGGGASTIADGIDQSGGFVTPRPNIPNVETNELHGPMLYLYRAFFPDTGGDGAHRGGRAAGIAWTPHDIDRIRASLTTHGVEVPVSPGLGGALPGTTNRRGLVRGSRVRSLMGDGTLRLDLSHPTRALDADQLGGDVVMLAAKTREFQMVPGDVLQCTWSGGGGYGDPLLRSPDTVASDVTNGKITPRRARDAYGVVLSKDGVDTEATVEERRRLGRARLERAGASPGDHLADPSGPPAGERVARFGWSLYLSRQDGGLVVECGCGEVLGSATDNWKAAAARLVLDDTAPEGIVVHENLELVQYLCPACGTSHAVDVEERGSPPLQDLRIEGEWIWESAALD